METIILVLLPGIAIAVICGAIAGAIEAASRNRQAKIASRDITNTPSARLAPTNGLQTNSAVELLRGFTDAQKQVFVHQANHVVNTLQSLQREHGVAYLLGDRATLFILYGTTTIGFVGDPRLLQQVTETNAHLVKASVLLSRLSSYPEFKRAPLDRDSISALAGEAVLLLLSGRNDLSDANRISGSSPEKDKALVIDTFVKLQVSDDSKCPFPGNIDLSEHLEELTEREKQLFLALSKQVFNTIVSLQREHGTDFLLSPWGAFCLPHGGAKVVFVADAKPLIETGEIGKTPFLASTLTAMRFRALNFYSAPTDPDIVSQISCYVAKALLSGSNAVRRTL